MGEIDINIICSNGDMFPVSSNIAGLKVDEFKNFLVKDSGIPVMNQMLIYKGTVLEDYRTLDSYGLQADHTIHLVIHAKDMQEVAHNPSPNTTTGDLIR